MPSFVDIGPLTLSGSYCVRNCANNDTSMKLRRKVIEKETAGHKKNPFFFKMATGNI